MNSETAIVAAVVSVGLAVGICGFWIWVIGKVRRRKPGLPAPDRSCERHWYSVGSDAK